MTNNNLESFNKINEKFFELFYLKFKFNLNEIDNKDHIKFILESLDWFCKKFVYIGTIQIIRNRNSIQDSLFLIFNEIERIKCLDFVIDKDFNKFKFSYKEEDKEIFSVIGYSKDDIYITEEIYTKDFSNISISNNYPKAFSRFLNHKNEIEDKFKNDFKIINHYKNSEKIINKSPLYRSIIIEDKNYVVQDTNFFDRYYFYSKDLEVIDIMYYYESKDFFIRFFYDKDEGEYINYYNTGEKSILKNLSVSCIQYILKTNKIPEDLKETDLNIISIINY